jgi:dienelactone hydrolase
MMALAENDDYVPPRACIAYADTMKQAGRDVELHAVCRRLP